MTHYCTWRSLFISTHFVQLLPVMRTVDTEPKEFMDLLEQFKLITRSSRTQRNVRMQTESEAEPKSIKCVPICFLL